MMVNLFGAEVENGIRVMRSQWLAGSKPGHDDLKK